MMLLPVLLAAMLAQGASAPAPITVTGHPWAPFISPMGEPFRAHSQTDDTLADWFRRADGNHDGQLTAAEMQADAERFFATLDSNHDGGIDPDEVAHYEWEVAPEIQVMSKTKRWPGQAAPPAQRAGETEGQERQRRRKEAREQEASLGLGGALQGAARYSLLNIPEPVTAADADFNRMISLGEFMQAAVARFQLLDRRNEGRLTLAQLSGLRPAPPSDGHRSRRDDDAADERIGNSLPSGP